MKDKLLISIIIPFFNAQNYIAKCLNSVLSSGECIEVICVNDGSVDNSAEICQKYVERDSRVKLISQKNSGVSAARNVGIDHSSGKWLLFVDADDYLTDKYYQAIESIDSDYDIVFFASNWEKKVNESDLPDIQIFSESDRVFLIRQAIKSASFNPESSCSLRSPCFKAYRREFLNANAIRFPQGVTIGEDFIFNIYAYGKASRIKYYPIPIYTVVRHEESATHRFVDNMIEKEIVFQREFEKALLNVNVYNEVRDEFLSEKKSGILRCLRKQIFRGEYSKKQKYELLEKMNCSEVFEEAFNSNDNNVKRKITIFLVKRKSILLLSFLFKFIDRGN